jgi:hypothetical protein
MTAEEMALAAISEGPRRIRSKRELEQLASELGLRHDWHEPDERGITAVVKGESFDNAGFWGSSQPFKTAPHTLHGSPGEELYVQLRYRSESGETPFAEINLATLLAWASEDRYSRREQERERALESATERRN